MSYFRGNFHGHGLPSYGHQGGSRFGILPVTRPRMPPGGINRFQNQNQGNFSGGGGNNFRGSPRNQRPRGGGSGGATYPARGEPVRTSSSSASKPSESKFVQPTASTGSKEEPKKVDDKKTEEKKTGESKKADAPGNEEKSVEAKDKAKPEESKEVKEEKPETSTAAEVTVKKEDNAPETQPKDGEKGDKEKKETPVIKLDTYNSELHMCISPNEFEAWNMKGPGFEYMWGGVRATHGVCKGKVCYEVHLLDDVRVEVPNEKSPNVSRVGWSVDGSSYQLGEDKLSWGYGGTGKASYDSKFKDYGKPFRAGDVLTCYIDLDASPKAMFFMLNGQYLGVAFRFTNELDGKAVYPHIACKNMKFRVNFGQDPPKHALTTNFRMLQSLSADELVSPAPGPSKPTEAEMIMMVGLPACGKSVWCENYATEHKEKKYYILGTNLIIDRMKVSGLIRKRNYHGRWEELIKRASAVLNKLFDVAKKRPRNYILDQTNVYFTARRRKMESFRGYKRIAAVIVNTPDILAERTEKQRKDEGKLVPEEAVMEMKKNFSLPEVGPSFDDIWYLEEQLPIARKLVEAYRAEGIAFKNKKPFSHSNCNSEPSAKKPKIDDRSSAPNRGFNIPNRGFQPNEPQQSAKPMETKAFEAPCKPDSRAPIIPTKRDERTDIRKDNDRDRSGSRDRRNDRSYDRGRDMGHRDDRRASFRDERKEISSRSERRDPARIDRREFPSRDNREPLRESRDIPRDNREHTRDALREPSCDLRDLPLQDHRREPLRDNRREPIRDVRRDPPRDDRRELSRDRVPSLDRNTRETYRGEPLRDLGNEVSRIPVEDNFQAPRDDVRALARDEFKLSRNITDVPARGNPYRDGAHSDPLRDQRRYPDWRAESFEDEYRSQATQDRMETFKRDLPFGRDNYHDNYYNDPRSSVNTDGRYPITPKVEDDRRPDSLAPLPRASRSDTLGPYERPAGFGRPPLEDRSYAQGFDSTGDGGYINDRPLDAGRRDFERPGLAGRSALSDPLKKEPGDTYPEAYGRYGGRNDLVDNKFGIADSSYDKKPDRFALDSFARQPVAERGAELSAPRDYSTGSYSQHSKDSQRKSDLDHPDASRYDQGRFGQIKVESSRAETGRFEQGRYDQPWAEPGLSDQSHSDLNRSDLSQTRPQKESYSSSHYNQPTPSMDQGSKSLMDIQVSDYGRRAESDQKRYGNQDYETSRYEQAKAELFDSYSNLGFDKKSNPPTRQDRFDNSGRPYDSNTSGALSAEYGGSALKANQDWSTPPKPDMNVRYGTSNYGKAPADRMASENQSGYYQSHVTPERQNTYRGEVNQYQSQGSDQSASQESFGQSNRDEIDLSRGPPSQHVANKNPYGSKDLQASNYEEPASVGANKSTGYSFTSNSNQNYNNDRMSYSYQTQMTTSTANYSQMTGAADSRFPSQKYGADPGSRSLESTLPPTQQAHGSTQQVYGRTSNDSANIGSAPPSQDSYGGNSSQTYEQQQQDYQKAYKQWYANYAQAYAQLAQQEPK